MFFFIFSYFYLFVIIAVSCRKKKDANFVIDVDVNCGNISINVIKVVASYLVIKRYKKMPTALFFLLKNYVQYVTYIILNNDIKN